MTLATWLLQRWPIEGREQGAQKQMQKQKLSSDRRSYLKIDYTNPDNTINRALTWREKDSISDDEESNGDAAETGAANDDDDVAGCETGV